MPFESPFKESSGPGSRAGSRHASAETIRYDTTYSDASAVDINLSDLVLTLNYNSGGFEAFFENLVLILNTHFGAQKVSLQLPRDPADPTNSPWGLYALWKKRSKKSAQTASPSGSGSASASGSGSGSKTSVLEKVVSSSAVSVSGDGGGSSCGSSSLPTPSTESISRRPSFTQHSSFKEKLSKLSRSRKSKHVSSPLTTDCSTHSTPLKKVDPNSSDTTLNNLYVNDYQPEDHQNSPPPVPPKKVGSDFQIFTSMRHLDWEVDPLTDAEVIADVMNSEDVLVLQRTYHSPERDMSKYVDTLSPGSTSSSTPERHHHVSHGSNEKTFSVLHVLLTQPCISVSGQTDSTGTPRLDNASSYYTRRPPVAVLSILSSLVPFPDRLTDTSIRLAPHIAAAYLQARAYSSLSRQLDKITKSKTHIQESSSSNTADTGDISAVTKAFDTYSGQTSSSPAPLHISPDHSSIYRGGRPVSSPYRSKFPHARNHRGLARSKRSSVKPKAYPSRPSSRTINTTTKLDFREISLGDKPYYSSLREDKIWRNSLSSRSAQSIYGEPGSRNSELDSPLLQLHWLDEGPVSDSESKDQSAVAAVDEEQSTSKRKLGFGKRRTTSHNLMKLLYSYSNPSVMDSKVNTKSESSAKTDRLVDEFKKADDEPDQTFKMATPSNKLLRTIIDAIPVHVFTAEPINGDITWVSNRTLAFRGVTAREFCNNPLESIHEEDRTGYADAWDMSLKKGVPLSIMVRVCRFDGRYRAFFVRAVPLRDEQSAIVHWFFTMMDIHNQHQSEIAAIQSAHETAWEHKYKVLAESSPTANFMIHPTKGLVYANQKWVDYSGKSVEESLGLQYLNFVHPDDRTKAMIPLAGSGEIERAQFQGKKYRDGTYAVELRLRNRDDDYRWNLVLFSCSEENSTKDALWFATSTDIQDQKTTQEKLEEAKDAAQRMVESKTRFLSNMSHEIRTPLIGISGMVNFLLETTLTEEQLDYCHTISSSADALLMVINDILDLSKVESGKMTLEHTWFFGRQLIEEVSELLTPMAIAKNLELNCVVDKSVPEWVKGDRIRLRQVLLNLIGNAIKFTDIGEIFSFCSAEVLDDETLLLKIEVHDTGRGFTPEDAAKRMFKPYSQIAQINNSETKVNYIETTGNPAGTGLGLVISRQLIELHGGKLTCVGEKGIGSVFRFNCKVKLPTERDHPSEDQVAKHQQLSVVENRAFRNPDPVDPNEYRDKASSSRLLNILVVCPWKFTCLSIEHHIRATLSDPESCKIQCVPGYEQLKALSDEMNEWTHVVVNLTEVDVTVDVLQLLFNGNISPTCQLIVLSSPYMRTSVVELLENEKLDASNVTFLSKPLKPSRYSIVFDPARKTQASQDTKMMDAKRVSSSIKKVSFGLKEFAQGKSYRILLAEDNLVNQKVIVKFLSKAGLKCVVASDGGVCVDTFHRSVDANVKDVQPFDLILCDLDMPRKDGFETCREIRAWEKDNEVDKRIPIVALSAYVMSDVVNNCKTAGFDKYLSKPVDFGMLKDVIIELLPVS